jgi:type II secretory pathway pseudopilin PulG
LIICPSCGSGVSVDLCLGCPSCGARAVGPPLAKPEHELPSFGRAALAFIIGTVMFLIFVGLVIAAFVENNSSFGFWTFVTAGEVAAWRVKWEVLFGSLAALCIAARIVRSISQNPSRFIGLLPAQIGLAGVLTVIFLVGVLIGITVPERMRQRQDSIRAETTARYHTIDRALLEYRELYHTLPTDIQELSKKLPDPDGSIADALKHADGIVYAPGATLASAPGKSKPSVRPIALRNANGPSNPDPPAVSFTSYDLRMPSEHRWFAADEDYIMQDGLIYSASDPKVRTSPVRRIP